jgi:hypothetical protein
MLRSRYSEMSVILNSEFATAEDTAAILGVSASRLRRLMRVAGPDARVESAKATVNHKAKTNGKLTRAIASTTRRKQKRGKTKKAAH